MAGESVEAAVNHEICGVLRAKHPDWDVQAEKDGVFGNGRSRADILVCTPDGIPMVIETKFAPAPHLEREASGRLGEILSNGAEAWAAMALRIPEPLRQVERDRLRDEIRNHQFEFCFVIKSSIEDPYDRVPDDEEWIEGGLDDVVSYLERASMIDG